MVRRTAQTAVWEQVGTTHKLVGQDTYYWGCPCTCDKSTCPVHGSITVRMTAGPQHMLHDHLLDAVEKLISHTVTLTGLPESDIRMALISTLREKR
jgi:hypothetical protein